MTNITTKPNDWQETTLGEVGEVVTGKTPSTKNLDLWGGETPFITPTDIQGNERFCYPERSISTKGKEKMRTCLIPKNAICYTSIASIGLLCISKEESLTNQQINSLVVNGENDFMFFYYFLKYLTPAIKKIAGGTTTSIINKTQFQNISIKIPPLPEQRAIAAVLSSLDDKIELLRQENETLEQIGQNLFKKWFGKYSVNKPEELPEGWRVGKIENLVDILPGFAFSSIDFHPDGQYKLVTIKNVQNKFFDPETKDCLLEIPKKMSDYCFLKTGDILLSLTGNVGRICLVYGNDFLLNQRVAKLKPKNKSDYAFSYFLFLQETTFSMLQAIASGTAQQNLSPIQTENIEIVLPPRQFLDEFSLIGNIIVDKINYNNVQIQTLSKTRNTLLPKLMSGEVRVKY